MSDKQLLAFFQKGGEWEDSYSSFLGVAYVTKERAKEIQHAQALAYIAEKVKESEPGTLSDETEPDWLSAENESDPYGMYVVWISGESVSFTAEVTTCFEGMTPT